MEKENENEKNAGCKVLTQMMRQVHQCWVYGMRQVCQRAAIAVSETR